MSRITGSQEFSLPQALMESGYDDIRLICRAPNLELSQWRPWRPAVGATLGWWVNRLVHRIAYWLTDVGPRANCFCPVLLMTEAAAHR
ncbi:MAG: hypothetical protein GY953_28765 [bacterium]|nr:hypothetical protein [bacterium]